MKKALYLELNNISIIPCVMSNYNVAQECGDERHFFKNVREIAIFLYSELKNNGNNWEYNNLYFDHRFTLLLLIELYQLNWYDANEELYLKPLRDLIGSFLENEKNEDKKKEIKEVIEVLERDNARLFPYQNRSREYLYHAAKQINITLDYFPDKK